MSTCYCLQFSPEISCELSYTDCNGDLVTETFYGGESYNICSQDISPDNECNINFYVNGLCVEGECVGDTIIPRNECDPITIFPMGVQCIVNNPTNKKSFDGSATLYITGGTPPYTVIWDIGSVSTAITNLGPGSYGATVIDFYGDFTANTICVVTAPTPTITPTPTPTPTPIPYTGDICFLIEQAVGKTYYTESINFNYNGVYNGKSTWISDDTNYSIVWMSGTSQWEVSGWTKGSIINVNTVTPPIIGWQSVGSLGEVNTVQVSEGNCEEVNVLSYNISKSNPTCECNGGIVIDVNQGNPPYLYSINNGNSYQESPIFNNLCFGTYNINVLDNSGSTTSESVQLNEPPPNTQYNLQLNLDYNTGLFNIVVTPSLPLGVSLSFDLVHQKTFVVAPNVGSAIYNNDVTLNVDGSPVSVSTTSQNTNSVNLPETCGSGVRYITNTTNIWQNITMINSTVVNGFVTNSVIPITPLDLCYDANGSYSLSLNNVELIDCDCCNVSVTNPSNMFTRE